MEVEIVVDETLEHMKLVLYTPALSEHVHQVLSSISKVFDTTIPCFDGEMAVILKSSAILRIHTDGHKLLVVSDKGEFEIKQRLYEIEAVLNQRHFVKISQSEIVNFTRVEGLDMSFKGTLMLKFDNGSQTYVSRRYVSKIKAHLGI